MSRRFAPQDGEPTESLADIHERLEEEMIAAGAALLEREGIARDTLESLLEYDGYSADERISEYDGDGPLGKLRWATRLAIEDAIGRRGAR